MSTDPIDDLAERLFASARSEGASERLVQRVLSDVASGDARRAQSTRRPSPARGRVTRPLNRLLWAAAACVVAGVAWSTLEPPSEAPQISAEVEPRSERRPRLAENVDTSGKPAPATTPALAPAPIPVAPESTPHHETRQERHELHEPSAPPRRPASLRAPSVAPPPGPIMKPEATAPEPTRAPPPPGAKDADAPRVQGGVDAPLARSLSDELQALERARAALRGGDGRAALRLLDGDGKTASFTRLAAEATLLRIEALYAVGELAESRRLADEFTIQNPDSHLGDRARSFIRRVDASRNAAGGSAPR